MLVRLAFSILFANLTLVFGAGILLVLDVVFGPIWWVLYGAGALVGAAISSRNFRFQISNLKCEVTSVALCIALHAALLFAACGIASRFIDVGWDSLETHQRAVHLIREGWNIVDPQEGWLGRQSDEGLLRRDPSLFTAHLDFSAMYVTSSLMADLPFGFEGGKGYRILLLVMVGVLAGNLLRRAGLGKYASCLVGLFVAANPVCLYQMWVLFMDFDIAVYSSLAIMSLYALSWQGDRRAGWVALAAILLLLVSKRSGLALALPLGGLLGLWVLGVWVGWWGRIKASGERDERRASELPNRRRRWFFFGGFAVAVALLVAFLLATTVWSGQTRQGAYYSFGFLYRAVFEPDQFDRSLDLVVPRSHQGLSRPEQFGRSLLEKTDIYRGDSLKLPLSWVPDEWETFRNIHWPGHGSGGFGPLFSGILLISLFAGVLTLRPWPPVGARGWPFRGLMFCGLIAICLVLPSWWARWVPFLWLIPAFFFLPPLFLRPREDRRSLLLLSDRNHLVPTVCAGVALTLALINSAILFGISTSETARVSSRIDDGLRSLQGKEVILEPGRNLLTKRWLIERGIDYRLSSEKGPLILELEPSTSRLYQPVVSP